MIDAFAKNEDIHTQVASKVFNTKMEDVTKEQRGFAINSQSEVKEAAFAVLEFMAGPEGRKLDKLGIKDIHYTETRRGVRDVLIARIHQYFYNMRMMAPIRLDDISHISNFVDTLQSDTNETSNEQDTVNEEIPQEPNRKIIKLRTVMNGT